MCTRAQNVLEFRFVQSASILIPYSVRRVSQVPLYMCPLVGFSALLITQRYTRTRTL